MCESEPVSSKDIIYIYVVYICSVPNKHIVLNNSIRWQIGASLLLDVELRLWHVAPVGRVGGRVLATN